MSLFIIYFLFLTSQDISSIGCSGNLLLNRLMGADIIICPYRNKEDKIIDDKRVKGMDTLMDEYAEVLR